VQFRKGNRVKLTQKLLSKLNPRQYTELKNGGIIVTPGEHTSKVKFRSGLCHYVYSRDLELLTNQQLLFNFMD